MIRKLTKADGTVVFTLNGKLHNFDGPALIPEGNIKKGEYYLFGLKYTKKSWEKTKKDGNGLPFYKTAAGRRGGRV